MKALSLTQPWASLVMSGAKRWETRSWRTPFRGRIAIHASKAYPRDCRALCGTEPFISVLRLAGALPLGAVLGTATLSDCRRTEDMRDRLFSNDEQRREQELAFGDYSDGRFAWHLENIEVFPEPIQARGMLGLWEWVA